MKQVTAFCEVLRKTTWKLQEKCSEVVRHGHDEVCPKGLG